MSIFIPDPFSVLQNGASAKGHSDFPGCDRHASGYLSIWCHPHQPREARRGGGWLKDKLRTHLALKRLKPFGRLDSCCPTMPITLSSMIGKQETSAISREASKLVEHFVCCGSRTHCAYSKNGVWTAVSDSYVFGSERFNEILADCLDFWQSSTDR
jgi:hypothetical protein